MPSKHLAAGSSPAGGARPGPSFGRVFLLVGDDFGDPVRDRTRPRPGRERRRCPAGTGFPHVAAEKSSAPGAAGSGSSPPPSIRRFRPLPVDAAGVRGRQWIVIVSSGDPAQDRKPVPGAPPDMLVARLLQPVQPVDDHSRHDDPHLSLRARRGGAKSMSSSGLLCLPKKLASSTSTATVSGHPRRCAAKAPPRSGACPLVHFPRKKLYAGRIVNSAR